MISEKEKNRRGSPLKFKSPKEIEDRFGMYVQDCKEREAPLTMSGLAVFLECDRRTLVNYSDKDDYFPTIKKIKQVIEQDQSERLIGGKGNATGIIFSLKNNYGWVDKQEIEQTTIDKSPFEIKIV